LLLFTACEAFEPHDRRVYYNVQGAGYVYYKADKEPAKNVHIRVHSEFPARGIATVEVKDDRYTTDSTGYFCVKFLKRTHRENAVFHNILAYESDFSSNFIAYKPAIYIEKMKSTNGIINLDTLWLE
jgi:hypothetical protein